MRDPEIVAGCSMQLLAVTWNSGVGAMNTFWRGCAVGIERRRRRRGARPWPRPSPAAVVMKMRCIRLCTEPRWVSWAPFGKPVVPEV